MRPTYCTLFHRIASLINISAMFDLSINIKLEDPEALTTERWTPKEEIRRRDSVKGKKRKEKKEEVHKNSGQSKKQVHTRSQWYKFHD